MTRKTHITAMLGLVAGKIIGTTKGIDSVMVRMPRRSKRGVISMHDFLDGLEMMNDEITPISIKNPIANSVVLMSIYHPWEIFYRKTPRDGGWDATSDGKPIDDSKTYVNALFDCLQQLEQKGMILITGSGDAGGYIESPKLDGWPANYGKSDSAQRLDSLLVVGGITSDVHRTSGRYYLAGSLPQVRAPAMDVLVPEGSHDLRPDRMYKTSSETSDAAALTAGLAAYYLALARQQEHSETNGVFADARIAQKEDSHGGLLAV